MPCQVDTSEEYQCLVSRFPTLLLTQKWYDTAPWVVRGVAKPQGLDGEDVPNERMKNTRSILSRGIVLIRIYYT